MKAKISASVAAMLLALGLAMGCSKSASNSSDAQIIGEVANKVQSDASVQTKAIAIQSNNGIVTLSGQVASDAERNEIASDAAQVPGVKTVVNNLTTASAAAVPAPAPVPVQEPKPEPVKSSARRHESHRDHSFADNDKPAPAPTPAPTIAQTAPAPVMAPATPPPPPKPLTLTIPEGTQIAIRLIDPLDTSKNQVGDRFRASIAHSIRISDQVAVPTGADVEGRVVDVKDAAHFSGSSVLAVELTNLSMGGKNYELHTEEYRRQGAARGKNTAEKVGGGAAVGAIIGAIAGGGTQAATRGEQIKLPTESVLNFNLASPLTVTPTSKVDHSYNDRPVLTDRSNGGNNNYSDNNNSTYNDNTSYNDPDSTDRPVLQRRPANDNDNNNNQPN